MFDQRVYELDYVEESTSSSSSSSSSSSTGDVGNTVSTSDPTRIPQRNKVPFKHVLQFEDVIYPVRRVLVGINCTYP